MYNLLTYSSIPIDIGNQGNGCNDSQTGTKRGNAHTTI